MPGPRLPGTRLPAIVAVVAVLLAGLLTSSAQALGATAAEQASAAPRTSGPIGTLYAAQSRWMGTARSAEVNVAGGRSQRFSKGQAYVATGTSTAYFVADGTAITTKWRAAGSEQGVLGLPRSKQRDMGGYRGARYQQYRAGTIISSDRGTFAVHGAMDSYWRTHGWERGYGVPLGDRVTTSIGIHQQFSNGTIYHSKASGRTAGVLNGVIRNEYARLGAEWGALGFPRSGVYAPVAGRSDRQQNFDHGAIVWTSAGSTRGVYGPIFEAWKAQGFGTGPLGMPTSWIVCGQVNGGCFQTFRGGVVQWSEAAGTTVRRGTSAREPLAYLSSAQRACYGVGTLAGGTACSGATSELALAPSVATRAGDVSDGYACYTYANNVDMKHCRTGTPGATYRIAVVGNCHMAALQPMFTELARGRNIEITPFMAPDCLWTTTNDARCSRKYAQQRAALVDRGGYDVVLLHGHGTAVPQSYVNARIDEIAAKNRNVVVIQDNPEIGAAADTCIDRSTVAQIRRGDCDVTEAQAYSHSDQYWGSQGATAANVHYVGTRDLYCRDGVCPAEIGSVMVYRDRIHVSVTYNWTIAPTIFERIGVALNDRARWGGFTRS